MVENIGSIVDWYGPFPGGDEQTAIRVAQTAARTDGYGPGLYAAVGHGEQIRRGPHTLLYVGMSSSLGSRITPSHHVLGRLSISGIWLGQVATSGVPGRRKRRIEPNIDAVEWATAFFLRIPSNVKKRSNAPPYSCTVMNRWWTPDGETSQDRPVARWADVIAWNHYSKSANLCWFGIRGRVVAVDHNACRLRVQG